MSSARCSLPLARNQARSRAHSSRLGSGRRRGRTSLTVGRAFPSNDGPRDEEDETDEEEDGRAPVFKPRDVQHVLCVSFDSVVDATDEMCVVGFEAARRFWPGKIPGTPADYADVFRLLAPCLDESSSFEGALMIRVMAEENLAERTRFRLELKRRKQERLKNEALEAAKLARAVTAKQRERLEEAAEERAEALRERRREYRKAHERMTAGRTTRPLNLREVVASWEEIKLHAAMKFGCELETSVGWEGRTVQPAGLQGVVDEVREAFSTGTVVLSPDDTDADADEEEMDDKDGWGTDSKTNSRRATKVTEEEAERDADASEPEPRGRWLSMHRLHHGVEELFRRCREEGHTVVVLGGPSRSGALCRAVLAHLGVDTEEGNGWTARESDGNAAVRVVGAEYGGARGLAVAAMMAENEMPWQRWHLIDSSLPELSRIVDSTLPETAAYSAHYAAWVPSKHSDRVKAEVGKGIDFIDHAGMFTLVGVDPPTSVMDFVNLDEDSSGSGED